MATITKPVMLDETGQSISTHLNSIAEKLSSSGATAQQVAQIEQNRIDVINLQKDVGFLKLESSEVTISSIAVNDDGSLIITLSDNTKIDAGYVRGDKGEKGDKGDKGDKGEQGDRGEKGDAYILTDADKQEVISTVLSLIPDGDEVSY